MFESLVIAIISFFVIIYDVITFPIYMIIYAPWHKMALSKGIKVIGVKIGASKLKTYTCTDPEVKQDDTYSGTETVNNLLKVAVNRYRIQKCLGTREILSVKESYQPNGTKIYKYIIGPYKWMTFNTVKDKILPLSRGLRSLGLEPKMSLALFMEKRAEWITAALSCFDRDVIVIVLDISMDLVNLVQIMKDTGPSAIITSEELLPKVFKCIDTLPTIKFIVYVEQDDKESVQSLLPKIVPVYSFTEVLERGTNLIIEGSPANPDDVAVIIFTKGTTNPPKAVVLTQRNVVSAMKCYYTRLRFTPSDVMISYLPYSSFIEFILELSLAVAGGSIGYSSNFINQHRNMKVVFGTHGDATVLQPTVMFAYPHLLKQFNKSISMRINKLGLFSRCLVKFGIIYKKFWLPKQFGTPITDRILFSNMAKMVGGKMRMIICGGGHLPVTAQMYSSVTLCTSVIQSYMLAENSGIGFCQSSADVKHGMIGKPMEGVYVRLEDIARTIYVKGKPAMELVIGGKCISPWSTNPAGKTDEDFFEDGGIRWFRTGDVVIMHRDGSFEFVDRKADIIKLADGKCVALGKLEAIYKMSDWVNNFYLHGDENHKSLVAILAPDEECIPGFVPSLGFKFTPYGQLHSEWKIKTAVNYLFAKHAKLCHLSEHEIPAAVMLVDHEWTLDSGLLTTTHQLKRRLAHAKYKTHIAYMYEELSKSQKKKSTKREILIFFGD